jgi:hypothetical protein
MIDFNLINEYIEIIEKGSLPENFSFNKFCMEFYNLTKSIPISKYLKTIEKTSKTPKIMNTKKAGEILFQTYKDEELLTYMKRQGYSELPEFDYKSVMLLRKVEPLLNWKRVIQYFQGKGSIQEINDSLKTKLFPAEIELLEKTIMKKLKLDEEEFNTFINKMRKLYSDKELMKSMKKLINNYD